MLSNGVILERVNLQILFTKNTQNKFYRYAKPPNIKQSHHYGIYTRQLETNHIFIHARYKVQQDYMYTVESWHC